MNLAKIDKFYIVLAIILALMAVLVIFTFRTVFSAYNTASELSEGDVAVNLRIDKGELEKARGWLENKESVSLEIR